MDRYHAVHGHDVSSFDIPSTHRLPAVSAAQALADLNGDPSKCVSTGLCELDRALAGAPPPPHEREGPELNAAQNGGPGGGGGVVRGQVTEFWGPPGCGKTAMGIQLAAAALSDDRGVVWVDCIHLVSGHRLRDVADAVKSARMSDDDAARRGDDGATAQIDARKGTEAEGFAHHLCPTLAHFVALLCKPAPAAIPSNTSLIVVDSLSALINQTYPKAMDSKRKGQKNSKGPGFGTRRLQTLQYIIGALQKLAATRNCAVVLLSHCATRIQAEAGAALVPAVHASVWDQGVSTRVVLFKDFAWRGGELVEASFAAVQKLAGKAGAEEVDEVVGFRVEKTGLVPFQGDSVPVSAAVMNAPGLKRKLRDTGFEIGDSEDDEYGWESDDARHLPPEPPQWQGSEDLIVGTQKYRSDVDEDEDVTEGGGDKGQDGLVDEDAIDSG